jgi:alkylated DNA nucleotide flippase Atl1
VADVGSFATYYPIVDPVIYAADIGSIKSGNFGWARVDPGRDTTQVERNGGSEIKDLVDAVEHDLNVSTRGVALGFECPLFVPVPEDPIRLGAARPGEGNRPWSGGPGTAALATGLVQAAWVLRAMRDRCPEVTAYLAWNEFTTAGRGLFLWEAFVTRQGEATTHVDDALLAAKTFRDALPDPLAANAVEAPAPLSLIGSALLWGGWSTDTTLLHKPCLVIRAASIAAVDHGKSKGVKPVSTAIDVGTGSRREKLIRFAEQIPKGNWSTYGCAAKFIGGIAQGVGGLLAAGDIPNDHRILNSRGELPAGAPTSHAEKLEAESVPFINGRADPTQKWCPEPL